MIISGFNQDPLDFRDLYSIVNVSISIWDI